MLASIPRLLQRTSRRKSMGSAGAARIFLKSTRDAGGARIPRKCTEGAGGRSQVPDNFEVTTSCDSVAEPDLRQIGQKGRVSREGNSPLRFSVLSHAKPVFAGIHGDY